MRAHEIITETMQLDEIERLSPREFTGGSEYIENIPAIPAANQIHKLPGGSDLLYSISPGRWNDTAIMIWNPKGPNLSRTFLKPQRRFKELTIDYQQRLKKWEEDKKLSAPGQLIGKLTITDAKSFPLPGAVKVDTIAVNENYRGQGIAKALYGIVLTIMKRPLLAGESQTPGGRKNWVSIASIPGVEIKGYIEIDQDALDSESNDSAENTIDIIMGKLGGQYIGGNHLESEFFAFDVNPNTSETELEAYVKTKLSKLYNSDMDTGLYAIWTGQ